MSSGGEVSKAVSKVGLDLGVSLNLGLIGGRQVGDLLEIVVAGAIRGPQFPEGSVGGLLCEEEAVFDRGVPSCAHEDVVGRAGGHGTGGEFSILDAEAGELETWRNGDGCLGKTAGWEGRRDGLRGH
jgi:hypothetical protein